MLSLMRAVLLLLDKQPTKVHTTQKIYGKAEPLDIWTEAQTLFAEPGFLQELLYFDVQKMVSCIDL